MNAALSLIQRTVFSGLSETINNIQMSISRSFAKEHIGRPRTLPLHLDIPPALLLLDIHFNLLAAAWSSPKHILEQRH